MSRSIVLSGALLSVSLSFHCLANPSLNRVHPSVTSFSVHDINGDGYIDRKEYQIFRQRVRARQTARARGSGSFLPLLEFDAIDQNADGKIGESEMVSALQQRLHERRRHRRRHQQSR